MIVEVLEHVHSLAHLGLQPNVEKDRAHKAADEQREVAHTELEVVLEELVAHEEGKDCL